MLETTSRPPGASAVAVVTLMLRLSTSPCPLVMSSVCIPGRTARVPNSSTVVNLAPVTLKWTTVLAPGANVTLPNPISSLFGMAGAGCRAFAAHARAGAADCLYKNTTSSPATVPVFVTVTDASATASGIATWRVGVEMLGLEIENVVYERPVGQQCRHHIRYARRCQHKRQTWLAANPREDTLVVAWRIPLRRPSGTTQQVLDVTKEMPMWYTGQTQTGTAPS